MTVLHDHADADMSACPHCATPAEDPEPAGTLCVTDSTSNAIGPQGNPAPDNAKLVTLFRLATLASTAAFHPQSFAIPTGSDSPVEQTPLNIRYCVFLI